LIVDLLRRRAPEHTYRIRTFQTIGDRVTNRPIAEVGDKGIFVRPLERALLEGEVDLAIHSLKDVPADAQVADLELAAFGPRADPRDALVSASGATLDTLEVGARVGTGSLRRRVQLLAHRPDLCVLDIRGNVDTRLRKLSEDLYDALVLAAAGLQRLDLTPRVSEYLDPQLMVPDAGQGIIAVQARRGSPAAVLARSIDDRDARTAAEAERAVVRALGATCRSPVGVLASIEATSVRLRAMAARDAHGLPFRVELTGTRQHAVAIGLEVAARLRSRLSMQD
jgi:hydroxymethylbilane synthase